MNAALAKESDPRMTINTERPPAAATPARTTRRPGGRARPRAGGAPRATADRRLRGRGSSSLPLLVGVGTFYIWPIIQTFWYSFTSWGVFGGATFSGLANYAALLADPQLYQSLLNTLIYTVIVLLGIPIAVWLASLLNTPGLRFAQFYRVLFFLPYVAMPAAIALVWRIIFNGDFGILNWCSRLVGIDGPYWISTPGFALHRGRASSACGRRSGSR